MMKRSILVLLAVALAAPCAWSAPENRTGVAAASRPVQDTWDWPAAMQKVADKFTGTEGVVLHIGDSISYANPYGAWARYGKGQTASDKEILKWMHTGENNDLDGWHLAAADQPGGRSYTAAGGMRLIQALEGGYNGLPSISQLIKKYNPQVVIFMLGTNDASQGRSVAEYKADLEKAVKLILDNGTIPVLSTIPPHFKKIELAQNYNKVIIETARKHKVPLIDFYGEIVSRQPGMAWNGTLMQKDDVHPSASAGDVNSGSEPTAENLSKSGYLLRGWLSVQKIKDVKAKAIDPAGSPSSGAKKDDKGKLIDAAKSVAPHIRR
jgi:lysophospholipase L1-like esterase